jgi:hypothetical protein
MVPVAVPKPTFHINSGIVIRNHDERQAAKRAQCDRISIGRFIIFASAGQRELERRGWRIHAAARRAASGSRCSIIFVLFRLLSRLPVILRPLPAGQDCHTRRLDRRIRLI